MCNSASMSSKPYSNARMWLATLSMLVLALAACSPAFNWRVVPNTDVGYRATFPDKPVSITRTLQLAGLPMPLTLQAAKVKDVYFAVGYVPLVDELANKQRTVEEALIAAFTNNLGVGEAEPKPVTWIGREVREIELSELMLGQQKMTAIGRFFPYKNHQIEVLLIGPSENITDLEITQFFSGFSLIGQ